MKQKPKFYTAETEHGLEILRVSQRGKKSNRAAIVTVEEMMAEDPLVSIIHPTIAASELIELGDIIKAWLMQRSAVAN